MYNLRWVLMIIMLKSLVKILPYASFSSKAVQAIANRQRIIKHFRKTVTSEIEYEEKNFKTMGDIDKIKAMGYTFIESPNSVLMKLEKSFDELIVEIRYYADDSPELNTEQQTQDTAKEFSLVIEYKYGGGLWIDCVIVNEEYTVLKVCYYKELRKMIDMTNIKRAVDIGSEYTGPDFIRLPKEIQNSFIEYINSLEINKDILEFIVKSAKEKEVKLYHNWLTQMKEFTNEYL